MTKIAFDCANMCDLRGWIEGCKSEAQLTTRYLPKRHEEMAGGSLYWIHSHMLVARSPLLGFAPKPDGKYWIRLEPRLITVVPTPRRAHQGWRYLADTDAPPDMASGESEGDDLPSHLLGDLVRLGLI